MNIKLKSLKFIFLFSYSLFIFNSSGIYQSRIYPSILIIFLSILFFPAVIFFNKQYFKVILILAIVLRILIIIASPNPIIDVYSGLKEAPERLLTGINPYQAKYTQVYAVNSPVLYGYWPYSFILEIPFVILFKDPRVLMVLADIAACLLIYFAGKKNDFGILLSLIYLFRPNSLFIIEQSWLTPLLTFLTFCLFLAIKEGKSFLTGLFLALISGVQPLFLFLLPLTIKLWKNQIKTFFYFSVFLLPVVAFFYFWNPENFISQSLFLFLRSAEIRTTEPIHLSLNLNTVYYYFSGKDLSQFLQSGIFGVLALFLFLISVFKKRVSFSDKYSKSVLLVIIVFYLFYLFYISSFINHYYYIGSLVIYWLVNKNLSGKNDKFN